MDKDEAGEARLPIGPPILAEPLLAQPRTTNIPESRRNKKEISKKAR